MLRPLRADDWDAWREVRMRCRDWLERWEPRPEAGSADPALDARRSARGAARGTGNAISTPRTASACSCIDGRFAGEVSLGSVQRGPFQMGYIGYWIDEALAGHGYVPEGVVLMMRHAFDVLQLHRLEAAIVPRNQASRRVAEKLGLRDEGTAVRFLQIQGVYEDHVRYAITAEEWQRARPRARGPFRQSLIGRPCGWSATRRGPNRGGMHAGRGRLVGRGRGDAGRYAHAGAFGVERWLGGRFGMTTGCRAHRLDANARSSPDTSARLLVELVDERPHFGVELLVRPRPRLR